MAIIEPGWRIEIMDSERIEKLLIVDDEQSILDIAREYFQHKGYQVHTAHNGKEAVEILRHQPIDCCFTDINMPEMDGLNLAEYIRVQDNTIPVIVMTGFPSLDNTIQILKNGVVDFLIKPVSLNQMELCLRRVLRERKLFVDNVLLQKEVASKRRLEQLNAELLNKVEELKVFNRIMGDFTTIRDSDAVFSRLVALATEISHASESRFYLANDALPHPIQVAWNGSGEAHGAEAELSGALVMDVVSDPLPLLVHENGGSALLPSQIASFMAVPLKIRDKVFGVLVAMVRQGPVRFTEKDLYYLSFLTQNAANAIENLALYENIYENLFATLQSFVKAIEARDEYTQKHSTRVTELALKIGAELGCSREELDILEFAGRLHDIGKIGIPDDILLKPGRLTAEEYEKIKQHPTIGADIVGYLGLWGREQEIIRCHHERFDGTGYPRGLKADQIPMLARVLSVADAFDAMASDRTYRLRMPTDQILAIIDQGTGSQFDPRVAAVFFRLHAENVP
jgi:putative nucleotidyltransferase with HDIG domain